MAISELLKITADTMSLYLFVLITKVSLFYLVKPEESLRDCELHSEMIKNVDHTTEQTKYENVFLNNLNNLTEPYFNLFTFETNIPLPAFQNTCPFINLNTNSISIPSELVAIILFIIMRQLIVSSFFTNLLVVEKNIIPNEMKVVELRNELKKRNLSTTGVKSKLIERLENALKADKITPREMTCVELRQELKKLNLSTIGKKSVLIERLENNLDCNKKSKDLDNFYNGLTNIICQFRNSIFNSLKSSLNSLLNEKINYFNLS